MAGLRLPCRVLLAGLLLAVLAAAAAFAAIDTGLLEQPWPRERARTYEVGKYPVRWRQVIDKERGILAGVRFVAPLDQQATWALAQDYRGMGQHTPGVEAVRFVEEAAGRQIVELDATVLWRKVTLRFAVEREPPQRVSFELLDSPLGAYRGVATFTPAPQGTVVEMAAVMIPAGRAPARLLLYAERLALLGGTRAFLEACEQHHN